MTYGHSPTESIVAALQGTDRDPQLNLPALEDIASYFRDVRKKYANFEGSLRGVDARILIAQVPGGMLTNMEGQLKEQGAADRFDEVLEEIPRVRKDLGYIPLVTPTSQIVGSQAVINVLTGERYKSISKETQGILKGEYGAAPAVFNADLQTKVLAGKAAITCRPADLLTPEIEKLSDELRAHTKEKKLTLTKDPDAGIIDDVLTYALFPQIGLQFIENRNNPDAFEPAPSVTDSGREVVNSGENQNGTYNISVNGKSYRAQVNSDTNEGVQVSIDDISYVANVSDDNCPRDSSSETVSATGEPIKSPLSGNIFQVLVQPKSAVKEGQVLIILEAMKMETEIKSPRDGVVSTISVKQGDIVSVDDILLTL
jgi:oxaloacetate decarboxylase alpha subunit